MRKIFMMLWCCMMCFYCYADMEILEEDVVVNGITLTAGTKIDKVSGESDYYDQAIYPQEDIVINDLLIPKGQPMYLYDGEQAICILDYVDKKGIKFKSACFNKDGKIVSGNMFEDASIDGIRYYAGSATLYFYPSGKVSNGSLLENTVIDGIEYSPDFTYTRGERVFHGPMKDIGVTSYFRLYESGKVKCGKLAKDTVINGKAFRAGQRLDFDEQGGCVLSGNQPR